MNYPMLYIVKCADCVQEIPIEEKDYIKNGKGYDCTNCETGIAWPIKGVK